MMVVTSFQFADTVSEARRQDRDERGSVSLCSLRSLRASMCQLFKIHKARGECQERTKFNDLHRLAIERQCEFIENDSREKAREIFIGEGQYQGTAHIDILSFYFSVT